MFLTQLLTTGQGEKREWEHSQVSELKRFLFGVRSQFCLITCTFDQLTTSLLTCKVC